MKKQRETKNLGINRSRTKEEIYLFIEKKFGKNKRSTEDYHDRTLQRSKT